MNTETRRPHLTVPATIRKVLLMGYNGANNTGSEARLLTIIKDVRRVLGPQVEMTIPTLCKENLLRYVREEATRSTRGTSRRGCT